MHANDMQKGTHVSVHIYRLTLSSQMLSTSHQSYTRATNSRPPWYSVFAHLRPHHRPPSPSFISTLTRSFCLLHLRPLPGHSRPRAIGLARKATRRELHPRGRSNGRARDMEGELCLQYFLHQRGITVAARGARLSKAREKEEIGPI